MVKAIGILPVSIAMQKTEIAQETGWASEMGQSDIGDSVGEDPIQNAAVEPNSVDQNAPTHDALLDAEDKIAPNKINAERPPWRHPLPRTALVVVGAGIIGLAIVQITQGNSLLSPRQNPVAATPTPTPTATPQLSGSENGDLKARIATMELKQKLQKIKEDRAAAQKAASSTTTPQSVKSQPTPVASLPPPRAVAYSPPPSYTLPPRAVAYSPPPSYTLPPRVQSAPIQAQPVQVVQPQPQRVQPVQPQPVKDPMEEWQMAVNVGRLGSGSSSGDDSQTATNSTEMPPDRQVEDGDNPVKGGSGALSGREGAAVNIDPSTLGQISQPTAAPSLQEQNSSPSHYDYSTAPTDRPKYGEPPFTRFRSTALKPFSSSSVHTPREFPDMSGNIVAPQPENTYHPTNYSSDPSILVTVGTSTSGKLDTPIRWSGDSSQTSEQTELLIKLVDPLKAANGTTAVIPAHSYLTVRVIRVDSAGILQLSPLSVQFPDGTTKPLPEGTLSIFDENGNLLQAKFHQPKTGKSFLSHLGDVAGIAGVATNNSIPYVLNALQNRQISQQRPIYFSLDRGTPVKIYVKKPFAF